MLETSGRAYSLAELRAAVPSSTRAETNGSGPSSNGSGLKPAQRTPFTRGQASAFIAKSAGRFTGSTEGGQNNAANVLCFAMGHFVTTDDHPGHWTRQEAEEWAWEAGEECGYAQRAPSGLRATIRSGLDAGMRDPFPCVPDKPADESAEHEQVSSWAPVDLVALLAEDYEPPRAEILRRSDGVALLYPGKLHSLHGESESGKSWVALIASTEVLADGDHVLFVDHESDAVTVVDRLLALGVERAVISDRFHYLRPDEPVNGAVFGEVLTRPYRLAVVDGVTEGISVEGLSSNDADQVAEWIRKVPRRIATATGAATVVVDHVTKTRDGRGRFALGSQHKMNALTGAAYTVDVATPFGRGQVGQLVLRVGKDRPGAVRPHAGPPSPVDRTAEVARVRIDARDPKSIAVRLEGWSTPGAEPTAERDAFTAPEWWHFDPANVPDDARAIRGPGYRAVPLVYARTFALGEVGGTPAGIVSDVVRYATERRLANHSRSSCKDAMAALQGQGVIVKTGEGGHVAVADEYRETGR